MSPAKWEVTGLLLKTSQTDPIQSISWRVPDVKHDGYKGSSSSALPC